MQGGATGTGTVTLLAPPTNSTQVLTLPDNTGTVVSTASTGVVSPAMLNGNQSGSAPIYGCRAWCNFDGTLTGTNAPRAGGNVTSVTRNGTGDYTVNFTVAMPDTNYAASTLNPSSQRNVFAITYASGSFRMGVENYAVTRFDDANITFMLIR